MTTTATRSSATGAPAYSETLPCEKKSVRRARNLVVAALHSWRLGHLADDGALITGELAANAIQHSRSRLMRVSVRRTAPTIVRIAVTDKSRTKPASRSPDNDDDRGRGLLLVAAVAHQWGTDERPWGKSVWATLSTEP